GPPASRKGEHPMRLPALSLGGLELRRFFRAKLTRSAIAGLVLLPLLYAGPYLWSFWDPFGRLSHLPVALFVEDKRALANGKTIKGYLDQIFISFGTLHSKLTEAADGAGKLQKGANTAASGAGTLHDKLGEAQGGAGKLQNGASQLANGLSTLNDGASQLAD